MNNSLDLSYAGIKSHIDRYVVGERTESAAFLVWFLQNIYRLDDVEALDAVCDGKDDKGIDGIYVDDNLERIDVFQSKLTKSSRSKTLGDVHLKEFVGTLAQLRDEAGIMQIASATSNHELARLIASAGVAQKIDAGYTLKGVFISNASRDDNTDQFLETQTDIVLYDRSQIERSYVPEGRIVPQARPVEFDVAEDESVEYNIDGVRIILAPLCATQLVALDGLASGSLFAWNVRQSLGRTKVNKEIAKSIENPQQHKNFLLYHNGLTILCSSVHRNAEKISISGYSVVNGCQSLTSLYESRHLLTSDLRILSRLIELAPNEPLADLITHHSNNQNPINARDLQSNSQIQRRLQNEFERDFGDRVFYRIKRGEASNLRIIDNQDAARVILAFDLQEPWTCHQTYKLFDILHSDIFARPEVTAKRIYVLDILYGAATDALESLLNPLMANYRLTRYLLLYLFRKALEQDELGRRFCTYPAEFLHQKNGDDRIRRCAERVLADLVIDLNAELKEREESGDPFDYKRELKGQNSVRRLEKDVISQYQKVVSRGRVASFGQEWVESM